MHYGSQVALNVDFSLLLLKIKIFPLWHNDLIIHTGKVSFEDIG